MAKYKDEHGNHLGVFPSSGYRGFAIQWVLFDGDGDGEELSALIRTSKNPVSREDKENNIIASVLSQMAATYHVHQRICVWQTAAAARKVLAQINEALCAIDVPMPEWATKAKAAGWLPPKGRKP